MSARSNNQIVETFTAAVALTAAQFHIMRVSAADTMTLAGSLGNTDIVGVLITNPDSGKPGTVATFGMVPVVCGSSISVNTLFTSSASGRAVSSSPASGTSQMVCGRVLEAASADGDIVTAWVHTPWRYTNPGY